MRLLDQEGNLADKSFGMSWWRALSDLDASARDHPTHLAIFGRAMKYLPALGPICGCGSTTRSPWQPRQNSTSNTWAAIRAPECCAQHSTVELSWLGLPLCSW